MGAVALAIAADHAGDGRPRAFLHFGLECGVHDQVGAGWTPFWRQRLGLIGGHVEEIIARIHGGAVDHHGGMGAGIGGLRLA